MAEPLCSVEILNRRNGSAVDAAAYLMGGRLYDERLQQYQDRSDKAWEVICTGILAPSYAPEWVYDSEALINSAEGVELQKNAQVLRKIVITLPHELTQKQNSALAQEYAQSFQEKENMIVLWAVHDKGDGKPHAHLLMPMRPLKEDGTWGMKAHKVYLLDQSGEKIRLPTGEYKSYKKRTTTWDDRGNVELWRQRYQNITNKHLALAGLDTRVDVRSYKRQGLDRIPTLRLTRTEYELEKRGVPTVRGDRNREIREQNRQKELLRLVAASVASEAVHHHRIKRERDHLLTQILEDAPIKPREYVREPRRLLEAELGNPERRKHSNEIAQYELFQKQALHPQPIANEVRATTEQHRVLPRHDKKSLPPTHAPARRDLHHTYTRERSP